ncbi:DUF2314 domain-containing protein [bacterium]|nr:DUF2314 domain-containing protein [bacterium]
MEKAIAKARATTDQFIKVLGEKKGENFAVKAHIEDEKNGEGEHIWLTDVSFKDGKFIGRINNEPAVVGNVKMGQQWTVAKDEISDWLYMNKGKMYGNYTLRPLLKAMPEAQAKQLRAILADP